MGGTVSTPPAGRTRGGPEPDPLAAPVAPSSDVSRNLSVNAYFLETAARHVPRYRFAPAMDFDRWRTELLPAVRATLGRMPQRVPLNAHVQAEWREHGLIKQRVVFDVEEGLSAVAYVFR